jgi:hypothetical protein
MFAICRCWGFLRFLYKLIKNLLKFTASGLVSWIFRQHLQQNSKFSEQKPVTLPICLPQILRGLSWDRNTSLTMFGRKLSTCAVPRQIGFSRSACRVKVSFFNIVDIPNGSHYTRGRSLVWRRYFLPFCIENATWSTWHSIEIKTDCTALAAPRSTRYTSHETHSDHTDRDRCLCTCCRQNINSSQLVLEAAKFA